MTHYMEGGFSKCPSWMVLSLESPAWMWLLRAGLRSTPAGHATTLVPLQPSHYPHRLKICFELMRSIISWKQPSATPHPTVSLQLMQPMLGAAPPGALLRRDSARDPRHGCQRSPAVSTPVGDAASTGVTEPRRGRWLQGIASSPLPQ